MAFFMKLPETGGNFLVELVFGGVVEQKGILLGRAVFGLRSWFAFLCIAKFLLIFFDGLELHPIVDILFFVIFLIPAAIPLEQAAQAAVPDAAPSGRRFLHRGGRRSRFPLGALSGTGSFTGSDLAISPVSF